MLPQVEVPSDWRLVNGKNLKSKTGPIPVKAPPIGGSHRHGLGDRRGGDWLRPKFFFQALGLSEDAATATTQILADSPDCHIGARIASKSAALAASLHIPSRS